MSYASPAKIAGAAALGVLASVGAADATSSTRWTVEAPSTSAEVSGDWAQIRNAPDAYVIGNAGDQWAFDMVTFDPTKNWYSGSIGDPNGDYNNCGWMQSFTLAHTPASSTASACSGSSFNFDAFGKMDNCGVETSSYVDSCEPNHPGSNGVAGDAVLLLPNPNSADGSWSAKSNVNPLAHSITNPDQPNSAQTLPWTKAAGTCVQWRYVTADDSWVMVHVPGLSDANAGWEFVPRAAFPEPNINQQNPNVPDNKALSCHDIGH